VIYTIQAGTDLSTWGSTVTYTGKSDTAPSGSGLPSLAGTHWEYCTFTAFNSLGGKGFIRRVITLP